MRTSSIARPGVSIRRDADRHQTRIGWLHGRHSFDTGIDPLGADTHHGVLVVSNHAPSRRPDPGSRPIRTATWRS